MNENTLGKCFRSCSSSTKSSISNLTPTNNKQHQLPTAHNNSQRHTTHKTQRHTKHTNQTATQLTHTRTHNDSNNNSLSVCSLFAVCCLLSAVCCLLFAVCCLHGEQQDQQEQQQEQEQDHCAKNTAQRTKHQAHTADRASDHP